MTRPRVARAAVVVLVACGSKDPAPAPAPSSPPKLAPPPAPARPRHVPDARGKSPADPWPAATFPIHVELPGAIGASADLGTPHRVIRTIGDPLHRWALLCQQRRDTNGDGKITYEDEMHFATGDRPSAYFVLGGGPGVEVDDVAAVAASGDYLVLSIDGAQILVDVAHQTGTVLLDAGYEMFTPDGAHLFYIEGDKQQAAAIRRTLATGATERVALPAGTPGSILPLDARWAVEVPWEQGDKWMAPYDEWCSIGMGYTDRAPADPKKFLWIDFEAKAVAKAPPPSTASRAWCDADETCHDLVTGKETPAKVPTAAHDDLVGDANHGPVHWKSPPPRP